MPAALFAAELQDIAARNPRIAQALSVAGGAGGAGLPPAALGAPSPSPSLGLIGLALSGGGIRSATFNLGVLQALHEQRVLEHVDYLSTVSGGGYIGGSVAALLSRGGSFPFERRMGASEGIPLRHLRRYANYLAPAGLLDRLSLLALMLRGLVVNFLIILPWVLWAAFAGMLLWGERIYVARLPSGGAATLWEQGFTITRVCFWMLLAGLVAYPVVSYYVAATDRST